MAQGLKIWTPSGSGFEDLVPNGSSRARLSKKLVGAVQRGPPPLRNRAIEACEPYKLMDFDVCPDPTPGKGGRGEGKPSQSVLTRPTGSADCQF